MAEGWCRRAVAAVTFAMVLGLAAAGPGAAQSISGQQLQALAERAVTDPAALAQLQAVQQVDGRPVDMGRALAGAEGPVLASRLRALAGGGPAPGVGPLAPEARQAAAEILEGRRFKKSDVPRPLAGVLRTLGRWLEPIGEPLGRLWGRIADSLAGQLALVVAVLALATVASVVLIGRRSPAAVHRSRRLGAEGEGLDPDELERQAKAAEQAGDLDRAVRLRFVAGVLRLDEAGVVTYRSSMTTGQLRARLRSGSFTELAAAFDEIAYGGRPAEEADVRAATEVWPRVLAEARR